jgi:hypothetical protein
MLSHVLADASIVLFAAKEPMDDHDWVSFRGAFFIVETVCEIDNTQVRRRVKKSRACRPLY